MSRSVGIVFDSWPCRSLIPPSSCYDCDYYLKPVAHLARPLAKLPLYFLLAFMDKIHKEFQDTLVIGAICNPWEFDSDILQIFHNRLYVHTFLG